MAAMALPHHSADCAAPWIRAPASRWGCAPSTSRSPGDGAGFSVAVEMEEDLGGVSYLHGRLASGQPIVLERRGGRENFEGRKIVVTVPPDRALVFDEAGERVR